MCVHLCFLIDRLVIPWNIERNCRAQGTLRGKYTKSEGGSCHPELGHGRVRNAHIILLQIMQIASGNENSCAVLINFCYGADVAPEQ